MFKYAIFLLLVIECSWGWTLPSAFPQKPQVVFSSGGPSHGVFGGQCEGITRKPVAGAINRILPHPTNADVLYAGSVNGGVWKTTNARTTPSWNITWTPTMDTLPSMSIGALQFECVGKTICTFPRNALLTLPISSLKLDR
jgi:hypothetical protein